MQLPTLYSSRSQYIVLNILMKHIMATYPTYHTKHEKWKTNIRG